MRLKGHGPIRMCVGCRKRMKQGEMVRFVQGPAGLVRIRGTKRIHGRSYYLCPGMSCVDPVGKKQRGKGPLAEMVQLLSSETRVVSPVKELS